MTYTTSPLLYLRPFTVVVYQGIAYSPLLFNVILDSASAHIQPLWLMMYVDDIALIDDHHLKGYALEQLS